MEIMLSMGGRIFVSWQWVKQSRLKSPTLVETQIVMDAAHGMPDPVETLLIWSIGL
jgi:hypothetical protein